MIYFKRNLAFTFMIIFSIFVSGCAEDKRKLYRYSITTEGSWKFTNDFSINGNCVTFYDENTKNNRRYTFCGNYQIIENRR